jgi:hypothetical protein
MAIGRLGSPLRLLWHSELDNHMFSKYGPEDAGYQADRQQLKYCLGSW